MTLYGYIQDGQIVLPSATALPEGAKVAVQVLPIAASSPSQANGADAVAQEVLPLAERLKKYVGQFEGLPEDASVNLDHYLYGTPKRQ